jgi:anti-sigma B factor antagonist
MSAVPLEVEQVGKVAVIRIIGKRLLEAAQVDGVSQNLLRLADDPGRSQMLLDFKAVEFLSSTVLATLLSLRKALRVHGGRLALCGLRPTVREVFAITGLEGPLNVYASEQEALQSF